MSQSGYIHLEDCWIKKETELAFLIVYEGEQEWIPKSQVANPQDYKEGMTEATISVTEFIAEKKGWR